jgi:hypothetical protein
VITLTLLFSYHFVFFSNKFLFVCRSNNKRPVFLIIVESSVDINQTSLDLLSRLLKYLFISFMLFIISHLSFCRDGHWSKKCTSSSISYLCIIDKFCNSVFNFYGFLFLSEFFFRTTRELEDFFLSRKARIFFPEFNIRLYDKNSELDFCFPPPKSEYFFQQHWESE